MKVSLQLTVLLFGLFVLLSPGMVLTLPSLTLDNIESLGVGYMNGSPGAATFCSSGTTAEPECNKPTKIVASTLYTSISAVLVHTLVFLIVFLVLSNTKLFSQDNRPNIVLILWYCLLFVFLSPGLFLTVPALSASACGQNGKNIMDYEPSVSPANPKFCAGSYDSFAPGTVFNDNYPNCQKCTGWIASGQTNVVPVLVHAAIFSVLGLLSARVLV